MSTHTPGPWHNVDAGTDLPLYICSDKSRRHSTELACLYGRDEETTAANARLIAAAPDLLAALEKIAGGMSEDALGICSLSREGMQDIARAAIDKATQP